MKSQGIWNHLGTGYPVLRLIALPFVRHNRAIFQHGDVRPHVARVYRVSGWRKSACASLVNIFPGFVPNRTRQGRPLSDSSSPTSTPRRQWPTAYILSGGVEKYPTNDNWQLGDVYATEMCTGKWRTYWVLIVCPWHYDSHRLISCDLARSLDELFFLNRNEQLNSKRMCRPTPNIQPR